MTEQNFLNRFTFHYQNDFLGGGSFGKVFKAYDNTLNRYVAVKIADQITHGTKTFSLLDEFNALEALEDHPNIAKYEKLYTFETHRGKVDYALMQYYPDGNLSNLIKKNQLSPQQRESMALQLLEGIRFLHQHQVVHRDLKPSNILIHQHDLSKEYIPKITDFGLSKKANTDKNTHFTNSFAAGTYAYSSPEQLKGETLRFNTDLWAYGAIVYEIFTGKTLFHIERKNTGSSAMDVREILDNIINSDTTSKVRELPAKWQPVVNACLERNAQTRVKTATELLDILHGKTVMQPPTPSKPQPATDETQFTPTPPPTQQPSSGDATQFTPTPPPTPALEVSLSPATQPNRTGWYIGIAAAVAMLVVALLIFKGKEPAPQPAAVTEAATDTLHATIDSLPPTPITAPSTDPAIPAWKTAFDQQFAAIQKAESQNTDQVNIKKYKALMSTLPAAATAEKKQVQSRIDYFTALTAEPVTPPATTSPEVKYIKGMKLIKIPGKNYYMGETEVTIGQYLKFCNATNSHWPQWLEEGNEYNIKTGTDTSYKEIGMSESNTNHPITGVSWHDAVAYCNWAGVKLPTEDQWIYAATGGENYEYAGSNTIGEVAWYYENSGKKTHAVKGKKPNAYGLYDMSGNVWEWTPTVNVSFRVLRGGCCSCGDVSCRVAYRIDFFPEYRSDSMGFRVLFL